MQNSDREREEKALTRRQLLGSMGTATAGLVLAAGTGWSGTAQAADPGMGIIPQNSAWYNVKNFGARGSGRFDQDDAPFIQMAIEAAGLSGGTVYLPAGRYMIKTGILLRSNVSLVGEGGGASMIKSMGSSFSLLFSRGVRNLSVEGIGFEGVGSVSALKTEFSERAIDLGESENITVRNCSFSMIVNGMRVTNCRHVTVSGSSFMNLLYSESVYEGYGITAESGAHHRFCDNLFKGLGKPCIYLSAGCSNSIVSGNVTEGCKDAVIMISSKLTPCSHHRIEGNIISDAGLSADETSCKQGVLLRDYCTDNVIAGNLISRAADAGISLEGQAAAGDERPSGNVISGNKVDGAPRGIALLNSDSNVLTGNDIRRVKNGIQLDTSEEDTGSVCRSNIISSNTLFRCSAAAVKLVTARCQSNSVYGNAGAGNAEAFVDLGTDTVKSGF